MDNAGMIILLAALGYFALEEFYRQCERINR